MVAGQDRNRPRAPPGNLHDHAAGAAQHVAAAHRAQVSADQPGAGAQADQPGRPHPPLRGGLRVRQRQEAADLRGAVGGLGPLPGQRHISRVQLRHHPAADEPLVGPQRPARHPGQPRRAAGEPLDHRRVQHHLRRQVQAQRRGVIGEPARRPQQVLRPFLPARPRRRDHLPGERRGRRRHRRRPPPPDIGGNLGIHTGFILRGMREAPDPGCDNDTVPPTPAQQARAARLAAQIAETAQPASSCPAPSPSG